MPSLPAPEDTRAQHIQQQQHAQHWQQICMKWGYTWNGGMAIVSDWGRSMGFC